MEELLVFENKTEIIIFEPKTYLIDGYIEARTGLNNLSLKSKVCPYFKFLASKCRTPTGLERLDYFALKNAGPGVIALTLTLA